jgi:hypothetical protein
VVVVVVVVVAAVAAAALLLLFPYGSSFLTSTLNGGEWSALLLGSAYPREKTLVGLGAGLDTRLGEIIVIQFNSVLYFNVLTQQRQEPITVSAQV